VFAQPRLAELATEGRSLHTNTALSVFQDEPVAVQPKHHAQATADVVYLVPASERSCSKSRRQRLSGPTCETVDSLVRFTVGRSLGQLLSLPCHGSKRGQLELRLEGAPCSKELLMVPGWRVDAKGLGVDLVDRHMHVFVVFVVVARGNVLVLGEP
jgi:hypothetical protein